MTHYKAAAQELDITEDSIIALIDQIYGDPDLYDSESGEITAAGMEVLREQYARNEDPLAQELLDDVEYAAGRYAVAEKVSEALREERDRTIQAAVKYGHRRTTVATAAGISRERLYQVL